MASGSELQGPKAGLTTIGFLESLQMLPWSWCQRQDFAELPHCGAALGLLLEHSTPMLFVAVGQPWQHGALGRGAVWALGTLGWAAGSGGLGALPLVACQAQGRVSLGSQEFAGLLNAEAATW